MILVDTHVLLWWLGGSDRLGPLARARIEQGAYVSAVSGTELTIRAMLGKVTVPDDFGAQVRRHGFVELPLRLDHADALRAFPELARHDPFDRMLLAQARVEGVDLLTADGRLLGAGLDGVVDARE